MFKFQSPLFLHKTLLKKSMLDELRDYPLIISQMMLEGCGNGILKGTEITWENNRLNVQPGLILYGNHIYRMEEVCSLACPPADRLTYIKVRFVTMDYEKDQMGGIGEIYLDEIPPENGEIELGRFRLQEGARLRTVYENFEDYQTEFDTVNRVYVPFVCQGGTGLWPQLLLSYASELLETGTEQVFDVSFAMQLLGTKGQCAQELPVWYVEKNLEKKLNHPSNEFLYQKLIQILRERKTGNGSLNGTGSTRGQMILL